MSKISVHQRKARTFIQREDWGNALAELERVLDADRDNPTLHNQIGDVYLRKDDVARACDHFERAIDLYSTVGLHNNAVALCKKVMRLRPGRHEMRYRLARLRLDQGFRSEAATLVREYFEHVAPDPSRLEDFEAQCREIIELLEDLAPVGKILEKLEAAGRYVVAFDIVRKEAQRAADAGDDKAAARFTEKMRSLRILVERSGGRDLLDSAHAPEPPTAPTNAAAGEDTVVGAAPPAVESPLLSGEGPGDAPDSGAHVDPSRLAAIDLPDSVEPARAAPAAADGATADTAATAETASSTGDGEAAPDTSADGAEPTLQLESPAARLFPPAAAAPDGDAEEAPPEFELGESSLADLEAEFGQDLLRGAPVPDSSETREWNIPKDAWIGGGNGESASRDPEVGSTSDPHAPAAAAETAAGDSRTGASPPANWVDALRRTPLWIPPETAPPSATPEGYSSGASMELESVIDSFREQMSRALDGDGAARYDLGVAYYEMGLYNEALAEFEAAAHCPGLEVQSFEMLAACLLHTGRHAEVVELLLPVLAADGHSPRGRLGLQYSLGLAYESLGDREQARRCFEEVALVDIDFKDVQARLQRIS